MWTVNFHMYKLDLEKAGEPEIKLPTFIVSWRKQGSSKKKKKTHHIFLCFIDGVDHNKLKNS